MSSAGDVAAPTSAVAPRRSTTIVIGLGEENRSEDRVGLEVVRRLRAGPPLAAELVEWRDEPTGLLDRWAPGEVVIVVDAMRARAPIGTVRRWEVRRAEDLAARGGATSTHGLSLAHAIGLAEALGQIPPSLTVYGIEVGDLSTGRRLSPAVERGVDEAVVAIRAELAPGARRSGGTSNDA